MPRPPPDQVYVLKDNTDRVFYCGISIRPHVRWSQHLRVARNGVNTLPEYEHWRFVGLDNVRMEVVDELGEFTEAEWIAILIEQGHVLLNTAGGVDVKRKKKATYAHQAALEGLAQPIAYCESYKKLMKIK